MESSNAVLGLPVVILRGLAWAVGVIGKGKLAETERVPLKPVITIAKSMMMSLHKQHADARQTLYEHQGRCWVNSKCTWYVFHMFEPTLEVQ